MITYKWGVWRRMLHAELACYLVWVLAFQAFVLIFQARRRPQCCLVPGSMSHALSLQHEPCTEPYIWFKRLEL